MAISRMQEPRQLYGLGSLVRKITRPIKKAVKGIGKIAKSPLGRTALLAAAGVYGLGALGGAGGTGLARFNPLAKGFFSGKNLGAGLGTFFSRQNPLLFKDGDFNLGRAGLTASALGAALPFLAPKLLAPKEEEMEEIDITQTPESIALLNQRARDFYNYGDENLLFMPQKQYVMRNFYAAEGGLADEEEDEEFDRNLTGIMRTRKQKGGSVPESKVKGYDTPAGFNKFDYPTGGVPVRTPKKQGGRIGFRDGSSTGNFGADRYASELVEAYKGILDKGDMFFTDVEKELIEKGEYPSPDKMKEFRDRYENLEKEYEKEEDKFQNIDLQDALSDKDAIKYYNQKIKDLEDREEKLIDKEEKLGEVMYTDLDVSGILRTPEFQEWFRLWSAKDPKADDLPNAEYFENMMFDVKRLRPEAMKTKYNVEMKDGGLMNLGGLEMDFRAEGGFVPIGAKEKADDVPARLSKNEFVMTADAVRGAGKGSIKAGAQKMYNTMKELERRVG